MPWKPSDKLIQLFNEEIAMCEDTPPCATCTEELIRALGYSADMLWNDSMLEEEELQDRIVTLTTAEFEKQLGQLEQYTMSYVMTQDDHRRATYGKMIDDAEDALRNMFYSRKNKES